MRHYFITLFVLIITLNLSAQNDRRVLHLSGSISEKGTIEMVLTIQNSIVSGYYFHEKHQAKILLGGYIQGKNITLKESPDYDSKFQIGFMANFKDTIITGYWIDKINGKTLPFKVVVDSDNKLFISDRIKQIEGNYENIYNSEKLIGTIDLEYISDNWFCFEISNGTSKGCSGYLKRLIEFPDLTSGVYLDSSCEELKFVFDSGTIIVTEKKCDWHGMICPFTGEYRKR